MATQVKDVSLPSLEVIEVKDKAICRLMLGALVTCYLSVVALNSYGVKGVKSKL